MRHGWPVARGPRPEVDGAYVFEQEKEDDVSTLGGDYVILRFPEARGFPGKGFVCRLYRDFHI